MNAHITSLLTLLLLTSAELGAGESSVIESESDDFEVLLAPNDQAISCFHNPSPFYVVLRNRTDEAQRLFEFWNSWGYQNIRFYFYMADGVHVVTKKPQDFTRNGPSTYEIPPGETMVFTIEFDKWWDELPDIAEGESKEKVQVVYECKPSDESTKFKVWTGLVASKVYEVNFWRAAASTLEREGGLDRSK